MKTVYSTKLGYCCVGDANEIVLETRNGFDVEEKFSLIFTSPPFLLNRKKGYGNLDGTAYVDWFAGLASDFRKLLRPDGSIVIEMGNAWMKGRPIMSFLPLKALLAFAEQGKFSLCQQFVWNNTARLPSPAQWVNVERIRVKDAFTHIWWMAPSDRPKADNKNVLQKYSKSMQRLLRSQDYNPGVRPSEHNIGKTSFLKDNGGAIPSNVFTLVDTDANISSNVFTLANTNANSPYLNYCRQNGIVPHPARMPVEIPEFFIEFLTEPGDWVLDPFAGSNTTGAAAEASGRRWLSVDNNLGYLKGSMGRFQNSDLEFVLDMEQEDGKGSQTS